MAFRIEKPDEKFARLQRRRPIGFTASRPLTDAETRMHAKLWLLAQRQTSRQAELTSKLLTKGWRMGTEMHSWLEPAFTRRLDAGFSRPQLGYAVAYIETQESFGKQGLEQAILHANDKGKGIVGGWLEKGKLYFDSVRLYSDLMSAYQAARLNRQIGFYHLGKGLYIKTEKTFQVVLDKMKKLDDIDYRYRA